MAKARNIKKVKNAIISTGDPIGLTSANARNPKDLRSYIAKVQLPRIRQDVQTWRDGIREAELAYFGQRIKMMALYYDTILNGHVKACIQKRRNLTLLRDFRMVNENKEVDEETTALFSGRWFRDFMTYVIDSKFFGYSLINIGDIIEGKPKGTNLVRRHNVFLGKTGNEPVVTSFPYAMSGEPFLEGEAELWHVWIPTPSETGITPIGYGLLYEVGLYEIILRNLLGFNSDWVEIFGQPVRHAKTNKSQEDPERMILENALEQMGSRAWIVTDPSDEITLLETRSSKGQQNPYHNLEQRCEQKISKLILGHADALDSVPGRLGSTQGEESPAAKALAEVQSLDGLDVIEVVQNLLIPKLREIGVEIPDGLTAEFGNDQEVIEGRQKEDANNLIVSSIAQNLKNSGLEMDAAYFTERTGIPVTKAAPVEPLPGSPPMNEKMKNKLKQIYK